MTAFSGAVCSLHGLHIASLFCGAFHSVRCGIASAESLDRRNQTVPYFSVALKPGDAFENIFERTIFYGSVRRISGFSTYTVTAVKGRHYELAQQWAYYGRASGKSVGGADLESTGVYFTTNGRRQLATDSSGPFFNPWIWGTPPAHIHSGTTWQYRIPSAWEVAPAGRQTVRVLSVDPTAGRVVLERSGSGYGAPLREALPKIDGVQARWGTSTWKGIAIVRHGLIESDQLVVRREFIVPAHNGKPQRAASGVEQIELGQVPITGGAP